ncbi:uncharacterized protein LY89DRAFT_730427 [Mollisia scopiformis]|uniref:Uncharacterized protein n=1 Tax=Mollisia scopiformis TaxID=149040 RepID=A0A194XJF6_MOLSC|nr:uncharacterized protein LY89DRAFT_730427 [Mollisia scopiformis]KUJ20380.1 hypothetical protein LY89DRAFT_730427 [Mollisia scopiformis]
MSDEGYNITEDRSCTITTPFGRTITWTPRPHTLFPRLPAAPTPPNSPVEERSPEQWSNGFYGYSGVVVGKAEESGATRSGRKGSKAKRILEKVRTLKSKFTTRLRMHPDRPYFGERGDSLNYTTQNFAFTTSSSNIATLTRRSKSGMMNRMREYWQPVNRSIPKENASKTAKRERPWRRFTQWNSATSDTESNLTEDCTYKQILNNPLTSNKPIMIQRARSDNSDTGGSMTCQPPSALDCAYTTRSRHYEQQAEEMIAASLSTADEFPEEKDSKAKCNHKGWRLCCLRKRDKTPAEEQEQDPSGQGAGNTAIPEDAEYLTTYSDSGSIVNIALESPIIDDSLMIRKTYDLRTLDYSLSEGQYGQHKTKQNSNLRVPRLAARQRQVSSDESDESDKPELSPHFDDQDLAMDDEISDLDLDLSDPSVPVHQPLDRKALAARLGSLPKLRIPTSPQSANTLIQRQSRDMEEISEKVSSLDIDEPAIESVYHDAEEERTVEDNKLKADLKEAIGTPLLDRVAREGSQPQALRNLLENPATEAIDGSYVEVSPDTYLSSSPVYLCVAHPSLDDFVDEFRPTSPRIGNYPALDSSATSIDFGFHPTIETMPDSWSEESESAMEFPSETTHSQEGRTWRDFSAADLPMGRVDEQSSRFARVREAQESCRPSSLANGRRSDDSISSVEAH